MPSCWYEISAHRYRCYTKADAVGVNERRVRIEEIASLLTAPERVLLFATTALFTRSYGSWQLQAMVDVLVLQEKVKKLCIPITKYGGIFSQALHSS